MTPEKSSSKVTVNSPLKIVFSDLENKLLPRCPRLFFFAFFNKRRYEYSQSPLKNISSPIIRRFDMSHCSKTPFLSKNSILFFGKLLKLKEFPFTSFSYIWIFGPKMEVWNMVWGFRHNFMWHNLHKSYRTDWVVHYIDYIYSIFCNTEA